MADSRRTINITPEQIEEMIERAATRAAKKALHDIGLDDNPETINDVRELRSILSSYRDVKKTMLQTFAKWVMMIILGALTLAFTINQWPDAVKKIAQ